MPNVKTITAEQVVENAKVRAANLTDHIYVEDYTDYGFYARLKAAYASIIVYAVNGNTVRAVTADSRFQYITSYVLDVDAGECACIHEGDSNSSDIILHCTEHTNCG